jgi:hypothetical protein
MPDGRSHAYNFSEEKTWISREEIIYFADDFPRGAYARLPIAINIFEAQTGKPKETDGLENQGSIVKNVKRLRFFTYRP